MVNSVVCDKGVDVVVVFLVVTGMVGLMEVALLTVFEMMVYE